MWRSKLVCTALLLVIVLFTGCADDQTTRAAKAVSEHHELRSHLPGTRMLAIEFPPELKPDRVAVCVGGVYLPAYMGGEVWRPQRAPRPPTQDPSMPYKILVIVSEDVKGGEVVLLDNGSRLKFEMELDRADFWWVIEIKMNPATGGFELYSSESPSLGGRA